MCTYLCNPSTRAEMWLVVHDVSSRVMYHKQYLLWILTCYWKNFQTVKTRGKRRRRL